jgi:hypothetical protein
LMRQVSISILQGMVILEKGSAKDIAPTAKGITITIVGAISQACMINIFLKKPQAVSRLKNKKANDAKTATLCRKVRTGTEHFLTYISSVIDC